MTKGSNLTDFGVPQDAQNTKERAPERLNGDAIGNAASTADLFPKLVTMQRLCGSSDFALLSIQAHTLLKPGQIECAMQSLGSQSLVNKFLLDNAEFLLKHIYSSPAPIVFNPKDARAFDTSPAFVVHTGPDDATHLAFPIQLGTMGNGFVLFFNAGAVLNNDLLIDLHRKSLTVLREKLRLAFGISAGAENLNDREIECLQLVGNGMKSEAIGEQLNLSVHTVNAYLGSATTKLNAVNRIQAIAKAIRLGIIA